MTETAKTSFLKFSAPTTQVEANSEYASAIQTLNAGDNPDTTTLTLPVIKAYETLVGAAVTIMEFNSRMELQERDVRYAAEQKGYHVPLVVLARDLHHNANDFIDFTKQCVQHVCNSDLKITEDARLVLQVLLEGLEFGTVTSTPQKAGHTYKLDSPVGVTANLFTTDWEKLTINDDDEKEDNQYAPSDEEQAEDEQEDEGDDAAIDDEEMMPLEK